MVDRLTGRGGGGREEGVGIDLGAGRDGGPRRRDLAVRALDPFEIDDRRLAGGRADVDAKEQVGHRASGGRQTIAVTSPSAVTGPAA